MKKFENFVSSEIHIACLLKEGAPKKRFAIRTVFYPMVKDFFSE